MSVLDDFILTVDFYLNQKEVPDYETRRKQANDLCEWYYDNTFETPPSYQLDRLANYLLADELRNKATHKVKLAEFPILSSTQVKLRNRRESLVGDDNLDFLKGKVIDNNPNAFKKRTQELSE